MKYLPCWWIEKRFLFEFSYRKAKFVMAEAPFSGRHFCSYFLCFWSFSIQKLYIFQNKQNQFQQSLQAKSTTGFNSVLVWRSTRSIISDCFKEKWKIGDKWPFWIQRGKYNDYRNSFNVNYQKIFNNTALLPVLLFMISK